MAACIVCNKLTKCEDLHDGETISLCARLEEVLDEPVPQDCVMCASCQCDLSQIEMYYTLLATFKKRYSETAKLRLQSLPHDTSRNILQETAGFGSPHDTSRNILQETAGFGVNILPSTFMANDVPDNANSGSLSQDVSSKTTEDEARGFQPVVKLEILDIRTVKDELQDDTTAELETTTFGETLSGWGQDQVKAVVNDQDPDTLQDFSVSKIDVDETFSDGSVGVPAWESDGEEFESKPDICQVSDADIPDTRSAQGTKRRGRPRKTQQSDAGLTQEVVSVVTIPRKRGRPRKKRRLDVSTKILKKCVQPSKDVSKTHAVSTKKPGRPRKIKKSSDDEDPSYDPKRPRSTPASGKKKRVINDPIEIKPGDSVIEGSEAQTSEGTDATTPQDAVVSKVATTKRKYRKSKKKKTTSIDPAHMVSKVGRPRKINGVPVPRPKVPCPKCDKVFQNASSLRMHMTCHIEGRAFVCDVCNRSYKTLNNLKAHQKSHLADKPYKCEVCGKGFVWRKLLKLHVATHSDARPFQCDRCERAFKTPRSLHEHIRYHHVEGRKYLCNICGLAVISANVLKAHMKTHSEERPYKCKTCGRGFNAKHYLMSHELTHIPDTREKYLCPVCGREFVQKSYLPIHMKQHTEQTIHTCSLCDKSFISYNGYKRHMMAHRGQLPFSCAICNKGFAGRSSLKWHMTMHTGERDHKCSCGKAFQANPDLQRHMRRKGHLSFDGKAPTAVKSKRRVVPTVSVPGQATIVAPVALGVPVTTSDVPPTLLPPTVLPPTVLPPTLLPTTVLPTVLPPTGDQQSMMSAYGMTSAYHMASTSYDKTSAQYDKTSE